MRAQGIEIKVIFFVVKKVHHWVQCNDYPNKLAFSY